MKRTLTAELLCITLLATGCSAGNTGSDPASASPAPAAETETAKPEKEAVLDAVVSEIGKYGDLNLKLSAKEFKDAGFSEGDIVEVTVAGKTMEMPVTGKHSDVDNGEPVLVVSEEKDLVSVSINYGALASELELAERLELAEDPGYVWVWNEGVEEDLPVRIVLKESGAYLDEIKARSFDKSYTYVREDYAEQTDEQYANFRMVHCGDIAEGVLYRSSSPINPAIGRNAEADAIAESAGIRTFINLNDGPESITRYEGYDDTYYAKQNIAALHLTLSFSTDEFKQGMAEAVRFILDHEGPYLIHCNEGKNRTGFTCALFESLMGADIEEIEDDYMLTYVNFNKIEKGTEEYENIVKYNIRRTLEKIFGAEDLKKADLAACAEEYLKSGGLSDDEIAAFKKVLSTPVQ